MRLRLRSPLTGFVAGAFAASVVMGVPAAALVTAAVDPNPNTIDGASPSLNVLPAQFVLGGSLDAAPDPAVDYCDAANNSVPLEMRWTGSDSTSGISGYDVWGNPGARYAEESVHGTSATSYRFGGANYNADCGGGWKSMGNYWVVARDNRGNAAMSGTGVSEWVDVWQEGGATQDLPRSGPLVLSSRTGAWNVSSCACFNWGKTLYSTVAGASLTYTLTTQRPGQTVALAVAKNTNRGVMNVSVDGGTSRAVNTYAATPTHRVLVWQQVLTPGTHTIKVTNAGTASRSRVDIDSILLTLAPTGVTPTLASGPGF